MWLSRNRVLAPAARVPIRGGKAPAVVAPVPDPTGDPAGDKDAWVRKPVAGKASAPGRWDPARWDQWGRAVASAVVRVKASGQGKAVVKE